MNENVGHSANYKNHTFWFSTIIPSWLWITHFKILCYREFFQLFYLIFIAYLLINVQHCTKMLDIDSSQFFSSKKNQSTKSTKHVFDFYWPVLIFIAYFHKSSSLKMNTLNVLHNQFTRSTGYVFDFYLYFHNCSALQLIENVGY